MIAQQAVFRTRNTNVNSYSTPTKILSNTSNTKSFVPVQDTQTQVVNKKYAPKGANIYLFPLFGEFEKTDAQKAFDTEFLKACDLNFKNDTKQASFFRHVHGSIWVREKEIPQCIVLIWRICLMTKTPMHIGVWV